MEAGAVQLRTVDREEAERSVLAVARYTDLADHSASSATDRFHDAYQLAVEPDLFAPQIACAEGLNVTHGEDATSTSINEGSTKGINLLTAPLC
jgi:hypothetical protein